MSLNQLLLFFSLFGAIQGFLIAILVMWQSRLKSLKHLLLVLLFLGASLAVLLVSMVNGGLVQEKPIILGLEGFINLSVGTLFLHYLILALSIKYRIRWYYLLYVPAAIYLGHLSIQLSNSQNIFWSDEVFLFYFQSNILLAGYLYLKFRERKKEKEFDWSGLLLILFLIIIISQWLRYILPNRLPFKMIIPFTLTLGFWSITLYGFLKSIVKEAPQRKSTKSVLKQQPELVQRIKDIVEKDEIYLDPNLTQHQLASQIEIHPNQLSILFKQHFQSSFNQYINQHRVKKAEKMLLDSAFDHLSVEGIGLEAGFKSRSVFYKAFKKMVGQTPAAFRAASNLK